MLLCLYVDYIIYIGSSSEMLMQFNDSMMEEFEMTYLGKLRYFLGFKVRKLEHSVFES